MYLSLHRIKKLNRYKYTKKKQYEDLQDHQAT